MAQVAEAFDNLFSELKTKETDKGTVLFSRRSGDTGKAVSLSEINRIIDGFITSSPVHTSRETVIVAPKFNDLPGAIQEEAERQGYDNKPNNHITGITYQVKIYIVQSNVQSKAEVEEILFHERIHQILHGDKSDPQGISIK